MGIQAQQWHKLIVIDPVSSEFPQSSPTVCFSLPRPNSNQSRVLLAIRRAKWWYSPEVHMVLARQLFAICVPLEHTRSLGTSTSKLVKHSWMASRPRDSLREVWITF